MDEFGVLVESIGFRAHGKSALVAKLKAQTQILSPVQLHCNGSFNAFVDDNIFCGTLMKASQYGGFDLESVFTNLNNRYSAYYYGFNDLLGLNSKMENPIDSGNFGLNSSGN
ncbi:ABC-type branched-chain amino acid transportsystem periplasmic component [Striga asiatica]|uniref:ABC-type branched-chain amino acid transportsystem periplasmic component n=1 Tax=Striga asiatica TaxID=4170 RepID=A0A5A7NXY6_STRAF|nr:ABC-type branched-chain amino acid transportsystem periplasmic component [Striga asiatica]